MGVPLETGFTDKMRYTSEATSYTPLSFFAYTYTMMFIHVVYNYELLMYEYAIHQVRLYIINAYMYYTLYMYICNLQQ